MANIHLQNKTKNLIKFLLAVFVLVLVFVFFDNSTYNMFKQKLLKNGAKYSEMYAYVRTKPSSDHLYFIVQNNSSAKSFFENKVHFINEDNLKSLNCSNGQTILIYEKSDNTIKAFIQKNNGQGMTLNQGTNIEFYSVTIEGSTSCKVGG